MIDLVDKREELIIPIILDLKITLIRIITKQIITIKNMQRDIKIVVLYQGHIQDIKKIWKRYTF